MLDVHELTLPMHTGMLLSSVLMLIDFVLLWLVFSKCVSQIRRLRKEGREADALAEEQPGLIEGPGFVAGTVEFEEDADYAVVVEIRQRGAQYRGRHRGKKAGYQHSWTEVERRCFTHAFWIRLESGERVRVEPGQDVELVDRLDIVVHDEERERFRIAELSAGERVVAKGTLRRRALEESNYREAGEKTWVLVPNTPSRLHLSADALGKIHRRDANRLLRRLAFAWLPFAALVTWLYAPHLARTTLGESVTVPVVSVVPVAQSESNAGRVYVSYVVDGEDHRDVVEVDDWSTIREGDELAYVQVRAWPGAGQLGASSTESIAVFFVTLILLLAAYGIVFLPPKRDWYRVNKLKEPGGGKLPKPRPSPRKVLSRGSEA
ncbi:MAG: hypothetical protein AB8H86_17185 [Polyangiales bacterium]